MTFEMSCSFPLRPLVKQTSNAYCHKVLMGLKSAPCLPRQEARLAELCRCVRSGIFGFAVLNVTFSRQNS